MNIFIYYFLLLFTMLITGYYYLFIFWIILSWIPDSHEWKLNRTLYKLFDPMIRIFRGRLVIGNMDLSVLACIFLLYIMQSMLWKVFIAYASKM